MHNISIKYAYIMQAVSAAKICKNMQNMQSRFAYAKYAKICTPHFADVKITVTNSSVREYFLQGLGMNLKFIPKG